MTTLICFAANTPNRLEQIERAIEAVKQYAQIVHVSPPYDTPAEGSIPQPNYLNCVATITTTLSQSMLQEQFKKIERQLGRTPLSKQEGAIPIDLDIVVWRGVVVRPRDWQSTYLQLGVDQLEQQGAKIKKALHSTI